MGERGTEPWIRRKATNIFAPEADLRQTKRAAAPPAAAGNAILHHPVHEPEPAGTARAGIALFSSKKFCKIFQILCHIKSLDACMKY